MAEVTTTENIPTAKDPRFINTDKEFQLSNIVKTNDEINHIENTFQKIIDILKSHCGPASSYAMLVDVDSSAFKPSLFTRDGIRILSTTEFMSPEDMFIKNMICYIGDRVDRNAKDGTTTSMLIAAEFLRALMTNDYGMTDLYDTPNDFFRNNNLSMSQRNTAVRTVFHEIMTEIENNANYISQEDSLQTSKDAGYIAFIQALSSSGGNITLANAMKTIFEKSPRISWEYISNYSSTRETDCEFKVEVDKFDYHIRCTLAGENNILNAALETEYIGEDVDLFIYPDALMDGSVQHELVLQLIQNYDDTKSLHILATRGSPQIYQAIRFANFKRKNPIAIWEYAPEKSVAGQTWPYELMALMAVSGKNQLPTDATLDDLKQNHICHLKKIHWHDTYMDLYGIVDMPDESSCIHPFVLDLEHAPVFYQQMLNVVKMQLENYRNGHKPDGRTQSYFIDILNKLVTVHRPKIRLGGNTYDQIANMEVLRDVQGAIMSSLNKGFLVDGLKTMYYASKRVFDNYKHNLNEDSSYSPDLNNFCIGIAGAFYNTVKKMISFLSETSPKYQLYLDKIIHNKATYSKTDYINLLDYSSKIRNLPDYIDRLDQMGFDENTKFNSLDLFDHNTTKLITTYPPIQPVEVSRELFKRLSEITIKLISTEKMVVVGGVAKHNDDEEED